MDNVIRSEENVGFQNCFDNLKYLVIYELWQKK